MFLKKNYYFFAKKKGNQKVFYNNISEGRKIFEKKHRGKAS